MMEYMRHSDFYAMCKKIRKQEAEELQLALKAHGGEFTWVTDDDTQLYDPPIIMANLNYGGPTDVVVHKAWLDDYDNIELLAYDNEWGGKVDFELTEIAPGHLSYLIGYMPVTDSVKSVAINDN